MHETKAWKRTAVLDVRPDVQALAVPENILTTYLMLTGGGGLDAQTSRSLKLIVYTWIGEQERTIHSKKITPYLHMGCTQQKVYSLHHFYYA